MTSIIKLHVISGGGEEESPHCYLLQVDEFRFLLDCGWDEKFNMEMIKELKKHVHQLDAVLLSYPDPLHLGALPYVIGKCNLSCPIYATVPIYKMGQMFMYDLYQSKHNSEEFDLFTLDDVDAAFDKIVQLKYNQSVNLTGKGQGLTITPLPAGHMIGGTVWRIVKDGEEDILYAVDFNHKKERHLNGCALDSVPRPSLLITDAYNATYTQTRRRLRDEQLMTNILQTLRGNGNVLIAVDTAGRVLELTHMLDQLWRNQESGLMAYSLALLNNVSFNVIEFAKSQVEWMSDKIMRSFEAARNNPFQFKHINVCHSLSELQKIPEPKVVLASCPDMECGFSKELFVQWCSNPRNSIILTSRTSPGTLARQLIDTQDRILTLKVCQRVKLEGVELEEHLRREKEVAIKFSKVIKEEDIDSEDSDVEEETKRGNKHDLLLKVNTKLRDGGFFKKAKKTFPMFPYREEKMKWDDYGEIVDLYELLNVDTQATQTVKEEQVKPLPPPEINVPESSDVPTKCITRYRTLEVKASIQFIDFEGRSDCESIHKIISLTNPRRLILVRGNAESINSLRQYSQDVCEKIYAPKLYETIDATTESHIYQIKLKDSLVSSLNFSKAKDAEVAWVNALITVSENLSADKTDEEQMEVEEEPMEVDELPVLDVMPRNQVSNHPTYFINEVKLSDFRQVLMKHDIQAEFSGGALVCNETIAVRRNEVGKIQLETTLTPDFFKVRDLLYKQYAII